MSTFINTSFTDGLLYKPSDILVIVESKLDETLKFIKVKFIVEKIHIDNYKTFEETAQALESYKKKIENSKLEEKQKSNLLTEISNLMLGLAKFVAPWIVKLLGWLTGLVVNTKTFGKMATTVSSSIKKITPDIVKKALSFAKDTYNNADKAFQNISSMVSQKVNDAFKGTKEKPPLINADAIKKAHEALVAKIEKWPLVGKVVGLGKKIGISPKGFYTFLSITILSVLAMSGSFGAAVILVLYGANIAAQRVVKAGKEAGANIADKAAQGIAKAKGETPQATPSDSSDPFADLENEIGSMMEPDQNTQQSSLSPELEDASNKWAEKLRKYIDSNNKDAGITKIKEALSGLVKSGDIQKEQVKPFVNSVLAKAKVSDDIKQALLGAMTDLGVALSESITLEQATSILSSSSQQLNESLQVNSAFGIIVKDIMESLEYIEEAPLQPELDSIAEKWAQLLKKYHDKGQGKVAFEKIKGAISSLVKDGSLSKEQVKPFIKIVVGKSNIPKEAKDELLGISGESDTPKSIPGAISTIKKLSSTISTPEEAKQKATSALKKAGLSKKFEDYENKIHNWVSKIPLVGGWYSKQSQTKKRIILGVSIAVLATLAFMGVKWATNMLEGGSQATPSDKSSHMLDPRNFQRSSLDGLQTSIRDNFINDHGGSGKTVGMANGLIRVIAKDGAEIIMNTKENGDISVVDKAVDPEQFNSLANSAKNLKDLM